MTPSRVQGLCFSHILKYLGFHGTLMSEPIAMAIGLVIAIVQVTISA